MALPEPHLGPLIFVPARLPARSRAQTIWPSSGSRVRRAGRASRGRAHRDRGL